MKHKFRSMGRVAIALVLALSLSLVMAVPVSAGGTLTPVATIGNDMAGATTTYEIDFTTETPYVIDSVEIEFAAGFNVQNAALSGEATGIGEGTVSSLGQVVTYTVTTPAHIAGSEAIEIILSGIVNPAADTYSPGITVRTKSGTATIDEGSTDVTIMDAPESFLVVPEAVTAGEAFFVTITAMSEADGGGEIVTGYEGVHLIYFSSTASDPKTIPAFAEIDFDVGAPGVGTSLTEFVLNVVETGQTITVTDMEINVTGTSSEITVGLAALGYLTITEAPASVTAGEAFVSDVTVTAYDAEGNASDDTSTVTWSGGGAGAVLPGSQALSAGTYTFLGSGFTLEEAGSQTITVTGGAISGDAFITVNPAAADELTIAVDEGTIDANGVDASIITVTAEDEFDNTDTNYTESVTFATSLGDLSDESAAFDAGVATATLTSTEVGTATILVTSGTLTDVTTTVTLGSALLAEVWVAIDGSDTNLGTEASPVKTIYDARTKVAVGGTIWVGPGTYTPTAAINIYQAGVILKSTDGRAVTIIDKSQIVITADDVTVDGFTVNDSAADGIVIWQGTTGVIVENNTVIDAAASGIILNWTQSEPTHVVAEAIVSGNIIEGCGAGINLLGAALDCTISDNTITGSLNESLDIHGGTTANGITTGNTITGNTITANECMGIRIKVIAAGSGNESGPVFLDNVIEGNTISENEGPGIHIKFVSGATTDIEGLEILSNSITGNTGDGILIDDLEDVPSHEEIVINFNNITGNTGYGLVLTDDVGALGLDATKNWWGSVVASEIYRMISETVEGDVDYNSQLNAPHAIPDITLATGWNLISLPLLPTDPSIETVLADTDVTVIKVAYYTPEGDYLNYIAGEPGASDLTTLDHGKGYWIDVTGSGMLVVTGVELALPGVVPPSYDLVAGWNLIGFTSTSTATVLEYLGPAVTNMLEAMYGYNAVTGLYQNIVSATPLVPGNGYWLAVTDVGTIFP